MRCGASPSMRSPAKADLAALRAHEAHQRAHGRGLAHAVAAHQSDDLALADREGHAEQHLAEPVGRRAPCPTSSSIRASPSGDGRDRRRAPAGWRGSRSAHRWRRRGRRQHADAVGEREHRVHVVLDQHDGVALLELRQQAGEAGAVLAAVPAIGSSSSNRRGFIASTMAISSWRRSPWERFSARTCARGRGRRVSSAASAGSTRRDRARRRARSR